MIASNSRTPYMPRLDTVNVPPWNSSGRSVPALALVTSECTDAEISASPLRSAARTIGVINPDGSATATATSACSHRNTDWDSSSNWTLTSGTSRSADAHALTMKSLTDNLTAGAVALISDRSDPMLPASRLVLAAREVAQRCDGRATVGRLVPNPGGTNVIPSTVDVWLDVRSSGVTRSMVRDLSGMAEEFASAEGCRVEVFEESYGDTVHFDAALRDELTGLLGDVPVLPTGAGHDAGILAAEVPTAMLFVRNPTGISHAPEEHAEPDDCDAGARALARVLEHLAGSDA